MTLEEFLAANRDHKLCIVCGTAAYEKLKAQYPVVETTSKLATSVPPIPCGTIGEIEIFSNVALPPDGVMIMRHPVASGSRFHVG